MVYCSGRVYFCAMTCHDSILHEHCDLISSSDFQSDKRLAKLTLNIFVRSFSNDYLMLKLKSTATVRILMLSLL